MRLAEVIRRIAGSDYTLEGIEDIPPEQHVMNVEYVVVALRGTDEEMSIWRLVLVKK